MDDTLPILAVNGLHITFAGTQPFTAVNNISFAIQKGKTLAIVGESGSGKSLTALAIMGLLPTAASLQGSITLQTAQINATLEQNYPQDIRGKEIGMVFQEPMSSLNPVMRVGKQLKEAILTHQPITGDAAKTLAIDWLGKVQLPQPEKIYDRYPHQLSGGQKQRIMIAMAMCNYPALLIADEPTTALDVTVQQEIIRLMHYLQQEYGTAMIFITHDLGLAATIADDVLVMYNGEMMEYGTANDVLSNPQNPYTKALLLCRPSAAQKGERLPIVADILHPQNIAQIPSPQKGIPIGNTLLSVKDLKVWFPQEQNILGTPRSYFKAVDGVSFDLHKGEVLGLVGESGCGKSTLSRALMGLVPVYEGAIHFGDQNLAILSSKEWRPIRSKIQMIFQDPYSSLNPRMTIGDMLTEPLKVHGIASGSGLLPEARRLLDLVQLPSTALNKYPHEFSGGQRQRIGIARALAPRPEILICDESVSALDVSIQAQVLNLLKDLQAEFGLTYLFIAHDLAVVHYISNRVMVMQSGIIVESGPAEQVLKHPTDDYTKRLIAAIV